MFDSYTRRLLVATFLFTHMKRREFQSIAEMAKRAAKQARYLEDAVREEFYLSADLPDAATPNLPKIRRVTC